ASLLRPVNLRRALAALRGRAPSGWVVTHLDVRPSGLSATLRRSWRERRYRVDGAFGVRAAGRGETTGRGGVPLGRIDPEAPARAIRRIDARTAGGLADRLAYVVYSPHPFGTIPDAWNVHLEGGNPATRLWRASADGRRVGRPGTPG